MQRLGGLRRKSRHKLRKHARAKGKLPLRKHLETFNVGDKVVLKAEPSIQGGMYDLKFHGRIGEVVGNQGSCYQVNVRDGNKQKIQLVYPAHLIKVKS